MKRIFALILLLAALDLPAFAQGRGNQAVALLVQAPGTTLSAGKRRTVTVVPVDKNGKPAQVEGLVIWTAPRAGVIAFKTPVGAPNCNLTCDVAWEGGPDQIKVSVSADAQIGAGTRMISATFDVITGGAEADSLQIIIGNEVPDVALLPVTGVVTIQASATDDVGVTRIQLLVDGAVFSDVANPPNPHAVQWDTATYGAGVHVVQALAFDAAGNKGKSTMAAVRVQ